MDINFLIKVAVMGTIGLLVFFSLWNSTSPLIAGRNATIITVIIPLAMVLVVVGYALKGQKEEQYYRG